MKQIVNEAHRSAALQAADVAEAVLGNFEMQHPEDPRPRKAIEATRAWARGEISVSAARAAAFAAHAAARTTTHISAAFAARAAGHAAASAHVATHAPHVAAYAVKSEKSLWLNELEKDKIQELLRPLISLINKSEKAQQKVGAGTWQHTMLQENLKALRLALDVMNGSEGSTESPTKENFQSALAVLARLITQSEKAQTKFLPRTSQHTLLQNRISSLRAGIVRLKSVYGA